MGGKVCLRCKGKTLLGVVNFENKKFVDIIQQCFALLPQVNFPANNLNFHWRWRWWDWIKTILLNLFYFKLDDDSDNSDETEKTASKRFSLSLPAPKNSFIDDRTDKGKYFCVKWKVSSQIHWPNVQYFSRFLQ